MSNKILTIHSNGYTKEYTPETAVNALQLTGSRPNMLPYEVWHKYGKPRNVDECYTDKFGAFHFDFNTTMGNLSERALIRFDNVYDYTELKAGTYTLTFRIKNLAGTYNLNYLTASYYYRNLDTNADTGVDLATMLVNPGTPDRLYSMPFTLTSNQLVYSFRIGRDFLTWSTTPRDLRFDFEFIGLFQGNVSVERPSNTLGDKTASYITSNAAMLGNYSVSTDVLRHVKQIERHLISHNNELAINFR